MFDQIDPPPSSSQEMLWAYEALRRMAEHINRLEEEIQSLEEKLQTL